MKIFCVKVLCLLDVIKLLLNIITVKHLCFSGTTPRCHLPVHRPHEVVRILDRLRRRYRALKLAQEDQSLCNIIPPESKNLGVYIEKILTACPSAIGNPRLFTYSKTLEEFRVVRLFTHCPGHNFWPPCQILIIFHTNVIYYSRICHYFDPRSYLQGQGISECIAKNSAHAPFCHIGSW